MVALSGNFPNGLFEFSGWYLAGIVVTGYLSYYLREIVKVSCISHITVSTKIIWSNNPLPLNNEELHMLECKNVFVAVNLPS